ncbi:MAG: hypothetical protein C0597_16515 [Marinilabiliales bacterium]|nr:MAG: hypothetical protein C0597_16515 [Marinilabiliales bacterium]
MIELVDFRIFVLIWIGIALVIFPIALFITAPYGRHSKNTWGPLINNRIGWVVMELPALLVFIWFNFQSQKIFTTVLIVAISLWLIHYTNRSLIFPFRIKSKNKKMPVVIMVFAIIFNSVNGFINGYYLAYFSDYSEAWIYNPRFIIGLLIFLFGFFINQYHDRILIKLRKDSSGGYQIPKGGLFKYISCPNFFGEIIEWAGFAILLWNLPALAFFIWTIINLVPRALDHHKWYNNRFNNYPTKRKAIIPYVL